MKKCDEASPRIILASQALLVKMVITLETHGIFGSNFIHTCTLKFGRSSSFGKMLITLEPDGIFCSNFAYLCILTLSSHWYEKK